MADNRTLFGYLVTPTACADIMHVNKLSKKSNVTRCGPFVLPPRPVGSDAVTFGTAIPVPPLNEIPLEAIRTYLKIPDCCRSAINEE